MFRRYRQRRGPYAMAKPSVMPSIIRSLILLAIAIFILYVAGRWILWIFGGANQVQHTAVIMNAEDRGTVNVSLEGGLMQRAEDTLKLFPGDRVTTGGNGHALFTFFDGSTARMDVQSDLTIDESTNGTDESTFGATLANGALWIRTPNADSFSGSITRTIAMPRYTATIPSDAEVIAEEERVLVFSADGQGVALEISGINDTIYVGEGQQFTLPEGTVAGDPYRYRAAIEPLAVQRDFIEESRGVIAGPTGSGTTIAAGDDEMLLVSAPADKTVVSTTTIRVTGSIAKRVERVRVNGNDATISRADNSFTTELSLKENEDTTLRIEALDARGIVLAQVTRTVRRGTTAIGIPTITSPGKTGDTYRTQKTEFAITGTVPAGTAGVMVNEYKLQLFRTGDTSWSYLASTALNNLKEGTTIYDVYALDAQGNKSTPARITILLEAGTEGVVASGSNGTATSAASSIAPTIDENSLPKNDPLMPGTIKVTGPAAGSSYTGTGSEFLLEGTVPKESTSVWVNGYRLQLYAPGKSYWNYIAKTDYGTLKKGTNVYRIVARNKDNEILDAFEYTVTLN